MCGIVGYIGNRNCLSVLMEGLEKLEYRGYDSAGVAVMNNKGVEVIRRPGHLSHLKQAISNDSPNPQGVKIGIGHTRWATHGRPCEENAHPHTDCTGGIALVHNGIIENFWNLKKKLEKRGHRFDSDTDTEVLAHLVEENYSGDLKKAVQKALDYVEGSFALVVMSKDSPGQIVAARKESPLVLGLGEGECFVASDISALLRFTRKVIVLEDGELALLTKEGLEVFDSEGKSLDKKEMTVAWDITAAEKSGYEDFMLKEIFEQPKAIKDTLRGRISDQGRFVLRELGLSPEEVKNLEKIMIVACGTSYHAALAAKICIESWAHLPVEIDISSEFRYRDSILDEKTLVIAITQSGETADTLAGIKKAKGKNARIVALTNVVGSSVSREADGVIYTYAGPEIGVAATKTFIAQLAALYGLAIYLARVRGEISKKQEQSLIQSLLDLASLAETILKKDNVSAIKKCAEKYASKLNFLFLGRGIGLPVAMEGALKLKEISYIHAEACAAGEMKHGPIALIDSNCPVVAVAPKGITYEKMLGNIQEVKAREATVIAVATKGDKIIKNHVDDVFYIPETPELFSAIPAVIPLQLFAYYAAKIRGCNVDQPRNLAKSVTVE